MTIREQIEKAKAHDYLTAEELALLSRYELNTIYKKARKGEIPGMLKWGRRLRFAREVVLEWRDKSLEERDLRHA